MTELDKRHRSSIYDSMVKSPNRAMLRATGMTDKDFETPIVGVISTWAENTPCNIHLHGFGQIAKEGVKDAGAWPVQFGAFPVLFFCLHFWLLQLFAWLWCLLSLKECPHLGLVYRTKITIYFTTLSALAISKTIYTMGFSANSPRLSILSAYGATRMPLVSKSFRPSIAHPCL